MKKTRETVPMDCPCGSGLTYPDCCGRYHCGQVVPDAESLMRSRYSAYVLQMEAYLLATWHASTRPATLDLAADRAVKWTGLQILSRMQQAQDATVEFVARYKVNGRAGRMHEISRFVCENSAWYYVDGVVSE